jgi:hypothetical protein
MINIEVPFNLTNIDDIRAEIKHMHYKHKFIYSVFEFEGKIYARVAA